MITNNYGLSSAISQTTAAETRATVAVASGNNFPAEKADVDSVQISDAAREKMQQELSSGKFVDFTAENGPYKLGLMAVGSSTIEAWTAGGLELSNEAIIAAGEALQNGLKQNIEETGSSLGSVSLNKHQIVMNSQDVPDWFIKEYENVLSSMEDKEMKAAFERGETFLASKPSSSKIDALASYASVVRNG
ncbi:MAG: hypothetical protein V7765_07220 [Oleispira sp.]